MSTQIQAAVSGALETVGLENVSSGPPGSDQTLEVTAATLKQLKAGDRFVVGSDGSVNKE